MNHYDATALTIRLSDMVAKLQRQNIVPPLNSANINPAGWIHRVRNFSLIIAQSEAQDGTI